MTKLHETSKGFQKMENCLNDICQDFGKHFIKIYILKLNRLKVSFYFVLNPKAVNKK